MKRISIIRKYFLGNGRGAGDSTWNICDKTDTRFIQDRINDSFYENVLINDVSGGKQDEMTWENNVKKTLSPQSTFCNFLLYTMPCVSLQSLISKF